MSLLSGFALKNIVAGAGERYLEEVDRERERLAELNAAKRQYMLESGMEAIKNRREKVKTAKQKIQLAEGLGLSSSSAQALMVAGQLDSVLLNLTELEKKGSLNKEVVSKFDEMISEAMSERPDEEKSAAITYFSQGEGGIKDIYELQDEFLNAVFSAAPEALEEAQQALSKIVSSSPTVSIDPFTYNLRAFEEVSPSERRTIRSYVADTLNGVFEDKVILDQNGTPTFKGDNAAELSRIFADAEKLVNDTRKDVGRAGEYLDIVNDIQANLKKQYESNIPITNITPTGPLGPVKPEEPKTTEPTVTIPDPLKSVPDVIETFTLN